MLRRVLDSDALNVIDYRCQERRGAHARQETTTHHELVYVRRGVFRVRFSSGDAAPVLRVSVVAVPSGDGRHFADVLLQLDAVKSRIVLLGRRQPPADFCMPHPRRLGRALRGRLRPRAIRVLRRQHSREHADATNENERG